jgi:hypothetical protein
LPGLAAPSGRVVAGAKEAPARLVLAHLVSELPELLAAALVSIASGQVLASYTRVAQRLAPAAAAWATVARQLQAAQLTQGSPEQLAEVVVSAGSTLYLLRVCPGGQLLCVATDLHDANLALVREILTQTTALLPAAS